MALTEQEEKKAKRSQNKARRLRKERRARERKAREKKEAEERYRNIPCRQQTGSLPPRRQLIPTILFKVRLSPRLHEGRTYKTWHPEFYRDWCQSRGWVLSETSFSAKRRYQKREGETSREEYNPLLE